MLKRKRDPKKIAVPVPKQRYDTHLKNYQAARIAIAAESLTQESLIQEYFSAFSNLVSASKKRQSLVDENIPFNDLSFAEEGLNLLNDFINKGYLDAESTPRIKQLLQYTLRSRIKDFVNIQLIREQMKNWSAAKRENYQKLRETFPEIDNLFNSTLPTSETLPNVKEEEVRLVSQMTDDPSSSWKIFIEKLVPARGKPSSAAANSQNRGEEEEEKPFDGNYLIAFPREPEGQSTNLPDDDAAAKLSQCAIPFSPFWLGDIKADPDDPSPLTTTVTQEIIYSTKSK